MRRIKTTLVATAVTAVTLLALTGCSKITEPFKDAPRSGVTNNVPADVITFPDGFSNVSSKCDGPNRVYVAFHNDSAYAAMSVVPNDPRCAK
jgi:hypothetical protein